MPITVSSLFNDSINFMRNQLSKFALLALFAAIIQFSLAQVFQTDFRAIDETYKTNFSQLFQNNVGDSPETAQPIQDEDLFQELTNNLNSLTPEAQSALIKDLTLIALIDYSPMLITKILLITWTIAFAILIINGEAANLLSAVTQSLIRLPKMLILGYICLALIAIGMTLLIVPAIIFYFGLTMAPIIVASTNGSILRAIGDSFRIMFRYPGAIISGVFFSIGLSFLAIALVSMVASMFGSFALTLFLSYFAKSLVTIFFTLYFYRLLSLIPNNNNAIG